MKTRDLILAAAGALALSAAPTLAEGTKADKSAKADAAWCRSMAANLSDADEKNCVDRMNRAASDSERQSIQTSFMQGGSANTSAAGGRSGSSGTTPSASSSGSTTSPSAAPGTSGSSSTQRSPGATGGASSGASASPDKY